jgi:hypothetical protein
MRLMHPSRAVSGAPGRTRPAKGSNIHPHAQPLDGDIMLRIVKEKPEAGKRRSRVGAECNSKGPLRFERPFLHHHHHHLEQQHHHEQQQHHQHGGPPSIMLRARPG